MSSMPTASFSRCNGTAAFSAVGLCLGESDQLGSLLDQIANRKPDGFDGPVDRCCHRMLHLHRLDDHQRLATPHGIAYLDEQLGDLSRHWGGQAAGSRIV